MRLSQHDIIVGHPRDAGVANIANVDEIPGITRIGHTLQTPGVHPLTLIGAIRCTAFGHTRLDTGSRLTPPRLGPAASNLLGPAAATLPGPFGAEALLDVALLGSSSATGWRPDGFPIRQPVGRDVLTDVWTGMCRATERTTALAQPLESAHAARVCVGSPQPAFRGLRAVIRILPADRVPTVASQADLSLVVRLVGSPQYEFDGNRWAALIGAKCR